MLKHHSSSRGLALLLHVRAAHTASTQLQQSACSINTPSSSNERGSSLMQAVSAAAGQHSRVDSQRCMHASCGGVTTQNSAQPQPTQAHEGVWQLQPHQQHWQQHWHSWPHPLAYAAAGSQMCICSSKAGSSNNSRAALNVFQTSSSSLLGSTTLSRAISSSSSSGSVPPTADNSSEQTAGEKAQVADAAAGAAAARFASKLQLPPVIVATANSTGAVVAEASRAGAKQVSKVVKLVQQTSLLQAASLQLSSIWQSHSTAITSLAAAAATAGVYHLTYSAAACFVDMSTPSAAFACIGASAAAVAGLGHYVRSGVLVDPERVYQVAMRKLTQHAGLQEVMGAPLAGSPMRVQLVARGSWFIQETMMPKRRAPRIHMLFPISGPAQSGVVSLQAKKLAGGKYAFKTLLVELPSKALRGAEGTAAATAAAQQATAAQECSSTTSSSSTNSTNSSNVPGDSESYVAVGATAAAAAAGTGSTPARVYIVGGPKAASSSLQEAAAADSTTTSGSSSSVNAAMSSQEPAAQALLEQLKQPLVFALQENLVIYEAEDEMETELGYNTVLELDPEQLTVWDRAMQGGCVVVRSGLHWSKAAGCEVVKLARRSMQALRQPRSSSSSSSSSKAQEQGAAAATAAGAASAASSSGNGVAGAAEKA